MSIDLEINFKHPTSFQMVVTFDGFDSKDVEAQVNDSMVRVTAKKPIQADDFTGTDTFTETIKLPPNVDPAQLCAKWQSSHSLLIEAPYTD